MAKKFELFLVLLFLMSGLQAQLLAPDEFLPHRLGEQFTPHHLLVGYVEHVADNSPQVQMIRYGRTYEGRPQVLAFISSPENLERLEDIRDNNLRRAGLLAGDTNPSLDLAIIWLGYSVHGNEAAGSESSMAVLYALANPDHPRTQSWLENTLIIIDPSYNPDGYSRYTHWYRSISNTNADPAPNTWEHREPWPRGRVNHYLFDLNRDWAWQTQLESQNRLELFNQWLPHIHVDVHEQGPNSPYYFAPAAKPLHPYITEWQRAFQVEIGKNNARYFDEKGWLYFTKERFDLFYPSYGDTYPTYNGSIGMTYEQGGIGAGRAIITNNGDTLTLADRVAHHTTTSLATIESTSRNVDRLLEHFADFYEQSRTNPPGPYKAFIIKGDNPRGRMDRFMQLLDRNEIEYGRAGQARSMEAYDYFYGRMRSVDIEEHDLIISAHQPRGILAQILLEPSAELEDSVTYDITAWSLPHAYGLDAYAVKSKMEVEAGYELDPIDLSTTDNPQPYAYLAEWNSLPNARFLAALLRQGIVVRSAREAFAIEGVSYAPGTLLITRADNHDLEANFFQIVQSIAREMEQAITAVSTGFSDSGPDLGSGAMQIIRKPRVVLLSRDGTSANSFGQVWHYFEQELDYPIHIVPAADLPRLQLNDVDVLILPEGRYRMNDDMEEKLADWLQSGGRLIAIGSAIESIKGASGSSISTKTTTKTVNVNGSSVSSDDFAGMERRRISSSIPGAVFKVDIDNSHPLGFGMDSHYFSLKTNELSFAPLSNGWNVGTLGEQLQVSGFAGIKARDSIRNTLVFGVENRSRGRIVYLVDNPLFRAFWENGKFLFSNAVFMVGR